MIVISDTFSHYIYNSDKSTLLSPNNQNLWIDLTIKQIPLLVTSYISLDFFEPNSRISPSRSAKKIQPVRLKRAESPKAPSPG